MQNRFSRAEMYNQFRQFETTMLMVLLSGEFNGDVSVSHKGAKAQRGTKSAVLSLKCCCSVDKMP